MTVLITLTTYGSDTGPFFDLYSDIDGYVTAFEQGVAKNDLIAGYMATTVPDFATVIRVQSTGECTNYVDISVVPVTTTSTTIAMVECYVYEVTGDTEPSTTIVGVLCGGGEYNETVLMSELITTPCLESIEAGGYTISPPAGCP